MLILNLGMEEWHMEENNKIYKDSFSQHDVNIKILGIGGGGTSVLERLADGKISSSVELVSINTDARALRGLEKLGIKAIQIGENVTNGYGTGGDWNKGELSAKQDEDVLRSVLQNTDMLFITAGLGGGAGSGIAPVVASFAKEQDFLSVAIVTVPFHFEGNKRKCVAEDAIKKLEQEVDALIVIQNDNLMELPEAKQMTIANAFDLTDEVLGNAVTLITKIITTTGDVNLEFSDIKTILRQSNSSDAVFAVGESEKGDWSEAMERACNSPLLKRSIHGAKGALLYISGGSDMSMYDINTAVYFMQEKWL